jgi:hypothetical protein
MQPVVRTYVEWRLTSGTQFRFYELINEYEQVDEDSDEAEALRDMIRSLPGFPHQAPVGSDFVFVVTDFQN